MGPCSPFLNSVRIHRRDLGDLKERCREHYGFEIVPFLPFLDLPSLKVFWVENDAIGHYQRRLEEVPFSPDDEESQLTELRLGMSYMDPMKMVQILKRCTKLEAFHRELQQPHPLLIPGFSWRTIKEALTNSRGTLKELTLNADDEEHDLPIEGFSSVGTYVTIGPLTDFTSLRILNVPQSVLLRFESTRGYSTLGSALPLEELLPSSLQSLTIGRCSLNIMSSLEDMLIKLEDKFPHLREIWLIELSVNNVDIIADEEYMNVTKDRRARVDRLKEAYDAAGVVCLQLRDRDNDNPW